MGVQYKTSNGRKLILYMKTADLKVEDFIGKKVGNFTVMSDYHGIVKSGHGRRWVVKCPCGREYAKAVYDLFNRSPKGCHACNSMCKAGPGGKQWQGGKYFSKRVLIPYRFGAKKRGHAFELDIPYLEELFDRHDGRCAYTGEKLTLKERHEHTSFTMSIDRIDNSIGYVKGNVQFVTKEVNWMKGRFTEKRFLEICKAVTERKKGG